MKHFIVFSIFSLRFLVNHVESAVACQSGWSPAPDQKRCFRVYTPTIPLSWFDAEVACQKSGANGHLASVRSTYDQSFIMSLITNPDQDAIYWMGANNFRNFTYQWSDNEPWGYINWNSGEPSNPNERNCGHGVFGLQSSNGGWRASPCILPNFYVCENEPVNTTCPVGWTFWSNACYSVYETPTDWISARGFCRTIQLQGSETQTATNADLVVIGSDAENVFVRDLATQQGATTSSVCEIDQGYYWIGLEAAIPQGGGQVQYLLPDDTTTATYTSPLCTRTVPDPPIQVAGETRYGELGVTTCQFRPSGDICLRGSWNIVPWTTMLPFICKLPAPAP